MKTTTLKKGEFMKAIYLTALSDLMKRIKNCDKALSQPNNMTDCGWTDKRSHAYWSCEKYKAIYKYETIAQRYRKAA